MLTSIEFDIDTTPGSFKSTLSESGISISEEGAKVFHYQLETKSLDGKYPRSNYIHPFYDLDGNVLTEDFPSDHYWHRGMFWAWQQVYVGNVRVGNPWLCDDFIWDTKAVKCKTSNVGTCLLSVITNWKSSQWMNDHEMIPFAEETVNIRIHPMSKNRRLIDFHILLKALVPDLKIGGSENAKGYGGFSLRIKNSDQLIFVGKTGEVQPRKVPVYPGDWLDIRNRNHEAHNHVAVLVHNTHPGDKISWILRNGKAMQNVAYPGRDPIHIADDPSKSLSLRYRLVIHDEDIDSEMIESWHTDYNSSLIDAE